MCICLPEKYNIIKNPLWLHYIIWELERILLHFMLGVSLVLSE